ncbi:MAG: aldose 1-epimerase family protein [Kiritimatiellae bacterium]|nr:aldose 1-epimerase family protein [Kiritimatiellia bacterium]
MNPKLGNSAQACSAIRSQITDGRAAGARLIHVANGKLNFILSESNALDILRLWHEGTNVGFVSKAGLFVPQEDFLHNFPAGMMYTCGLDAIGGVDGHYPHGRLHKTPAQIVELKAGEKGVRIVAEVKDAALFGPNLVLTRTLETAAGSGEISVTDVLENRAFRDERYCLLYHVNLGWPFVDEGAKIEGAIVKSVPRTPWAEKHKATMLKVEKPADNWEETCYFLETKDGALSLVNRKLGKRFTVKSSFRKFVEWKSRASGDYVIGLEPCSSWLDGNLRYSTLKPGAKATSRVVLKAENI